MVQGTAQRLRRALRQRQPDLDHPVAHAQDGLRDARRPSGWPSSPRSATSSPRRPTCQPDSWAPYVGRNAFAHKGGMHAAGIERRRPQTYEHIDPERGRQRRAACWSSSCRAAARSSPRRGSSASTSRTTRAQSPAILGAAQGARAPGLPLRGGRRRRSSCSSSARSGVYEPLFTLESFRVITEKRADGRVETEATVKIVHDGERLVATAEGNGPVNALDAALRTALGRGCRSSAEHRAGQLQGADPGRDQGHRRDHPRAHRLQRRRSETWGAHRGERERHRGLVGGAGRQPRARRRAAWPRRAAARRLSHRA